MPDINQSMNLWYDGKTHACVTYGFSDSVKGCGQIVPPTNMVAYYLNNGYLRACVRTEKMEMKCGPVQKLYTPNFLVDNWGWVALALAIGYWLYQSRKKVVEQRPTPG